MCEWMLECTLEYKVINVVGELDIFSIATYGLHRLSCSSNDDTF